MKRIFLPLLVCFSIYSCDELMPLVDTYNQTILEPSESEVISGLKEALSVGVRNAVNQTAQKDGFYGNSLIKIPIPPEAQKIEDALNKFNMGHLMDDFDKSLNRAAEVASAKATDVFIDAITQMTITDAISIWQGSEDAATQYLKRTTTPRLKSEFSPIVTSAIDEVHVTKYWNDAAKYYNQIPFTQPVNPDLEDYVTSKTIDGLFLLVAKEEKKIRDDPAARVSDILVRVFGYQPQP